MTLFVCCVHYEDRDRIYSLLLEFPGRGGRELPVDLGRSTPLYRSRLLSSVSLRFSATGGRVEIGAGV